jgi:hypothetical protein
MKKFFVIGALEFILLSVLVLADADINDDRIVDIFDIVYVASRFS